MSAGEKSPRTLSIFLIGNKPALVGRNKTEQDLRIKEILERFALNNDFKVLVEKEDISFGIDTRGVDSFAIFLYCSERFSPLIYVAETGLPVIIIGEENTFSNALDTYEYLADHGNVEVVLNPSEANRKLSVSRAVKWIKKTKICLFEMRQWKLDGIAWHKNPIVRGTLNMQSTNKEEFFNIYENVDIVKAESQASKWMNESTVLEPSFEDVVKSARLYIAMKTDAAYVLWCGQFIKRLGTKMCFALAKLGDDGYDVGCWRGENLVPLLILHAASGKSVFVCETHRRRGNIITLRHCFVPSQIGSGKFVLRKWRNMEGTVTGYCQLPKGEVTVVNCGIGDKIVVVKGRVLDCKDLGGENCRMTVWVEIQNEESIRKFVGRECAMVYGDYEEEARETGAKLGLQVL